MKLFTLFLALSTLLFAMSQKPQKDDKVSKKIVDDWEYNATKLFMEGGTYKHSSRIMPTLATSAMPLPTPAIAVKKSIGFAVGGAKDANNFYDNIQNGYLPKLKSLTYEGVFYNHYFDTAAKNETCQNLFCPSYTTAIQKNLFTNAKEYYLSVGLNSNIQVKDFKRKILNLVVVLDISGSMSSPFNRYYYDTKRQKGVPEDAKLSKMEVANRSLAAMLKHLQPQDSLGIVLFDNNAYLAKPLRKVALTDMEAIKKHILELKPKGGTNWSGGYQKGVALFESLFKEQNDPHLYENRIIFITDAMPNTGELSDKGLFGMVEHASNKGIYTSFIGVGVDFNTNLVERVTKTKGANYVSVHSLKEFQKRLDEEFDYMVTPLVFDLKLSLQSDTFTIEGVYGSPEADLATQTLLYVNTLFPSKTKEGKTKGGVVLVKLKQNNTSTTKTPITLTVTYKDREGTLYRSQKKVTLKDGLYYENSGIQKAILLSEYVTLMQNWLIDMRKACNDSVQQNPLPFYQRVTLYPPKRKEYFMIQSWEKRSCPLDVSAGYKNLFALFGQKFRQEMAVLEDKSLQKEYNTLKKLADFKATEAKQSGKIDDWQGGN